MLVTTEKLLPLCQAYQTYETYQAYEITKQRLTLKT